MPRGESSLIPNCLLNLIVTYWKERFMTPPEAERNVLKLNNVQKEATNMSVAALREGLLEAYAGDSEKCGKIRRAQKGNFASPDSLVSMFYDLTRESSTF